MAINLVDEHFPPEYILEQCQLSLVLSFLVLISIFQWFVVSKTGIRNSRAGKILCYVLSWWNMKTSRYSYLEYNVGPVIHCRLFGRSVFANFPGEVF